MTSIPFIQGFMPLQILVELALVLGTFTLISYRQEKRGQPLNKLFQAVVLFAFCVWYLKYRIYPPLPLAIVQMYAVVAGIGIFGWISSNESYWQEVRQPLLAMLDGTTPLARAVRIAVMIALPLLFGGYAFSLMQPVDVNANAPLDLRIYHSSPPTTIVVYNPEDFAR